MRYLLALGAGVAVTLALFFFMSVLIDQGKKRPTVNDIGPIVEFVRVKRDQDTKLRNRELPKKPPPPKAAPKKPKLAVSDNDQPDQNDLQIQAPKLANGLKGGIGPYLGGGGGRRDGDLIPIVRINPQVPRKARIKGIEGYVVVSFVVSKSGATKDVTVIEAKPPRIFNRVARKAILKWRYKPQFEEGKPVEVAQKVRLDFGLEDEE